MTIFTPATDADVLDAVQWAVSEESPLEIVGHGSKRGIGRPPQTEHTLDMSGLSGITLYEPEELVLSAKAGTPIAEMEAELERNNQQLAFEPMDYGPLFGDEAGRGTIGGLLAANLSGPRRIKAGAARDHVLGIHAVSGRGEAFKSGGRVVKNVTGYDLSKVMAGSWGTLAAVTDITMKVLPAAEAEATLAVSGLDDEQAVRLMADAMGSSADVSGAAHLPLTVMNGIAGGELGTDPLTVLRLEGFGPSVAARIDFLMPMLERAGSVQTLDKDMSRRLWRDIRDCRPFADGTEKPVWRVSMAPGEGYRMLDALRREAGVNAYYDWQGGLIWLRMEAEPEAEALRRQIARFGGGHATLVRAAPALRASLPVFQPQLAALAALSARLKEQFDPKNVLNPGRMTTN